MLNAQKLAFDTIVMAITDDPPHTHFFLQKAGGTGKIFLYMALYYHYHAQSKIVLCVASFGIAAEFLAGIQTSHSQFLIPLMIH